MVTNPTRNHTTIQHHVSSVYNDMVNDIKVFVSDVVRVDSLMSWVILYVINIFFKCSVSLSELSRKLQFVSPSIIVSLSSDSIELINSPSHQSTPQAY